MGENLRRPIGYTILEQAERVPHKPALICVADDDSVRQLSWLELHAHSDQLARFLKRQVKEKHKRIAVELGNVPEHVLWALAIWKIGCCYFSLPSTCSQEERVRTYTQISPDLIIRDTADSGSPWDEVSGGREPWNTLEIPEDEPLEYCAEIPSKGMLTGGTTGPPKMVLTCLPVSSSEASLQRYFSMSGQDYGMVQLIVGPIYHGSPNMTLCMGFMAQQTVVLTERFHAEQAVALIEKYRVECLYLVPTMMKRIADLPDIEKRDLSSIKGLCHTGGYCSQELKRRWIDLIGSEHIYETYSMTEAIGMTAIRGDEWLKHPGSVGKGLGCSIEIRMDGAPVAAGVIGEIYMRQERGLYQRSKVEGSRAPRCEKDDGFYSVGDLGWLEEEGYLHFVDRRDDMVVTGGKNVYVSEVEKVLMECDCVFDAAVVGAPDPEWGRRLCACVVLKMRPGQTEEECLHTLRTHAKERLSAYMVPKEYHFLEELPRNAMGKLMRRKIAGGRTLTNEN